jgi:hypothetical protein
MDEIDVIVDSRELNPAFSRELKAICKKEPSFMEIYEQYVKGFLKFLFATDIATACNNNEFNNFVSNITEIASPGGQYKIYKFRVRFENRGKSESPRIFVAVVVNFRVIPLGIYTHGNTRGEMSVLDCVKRLEKVMENLSSKENGREREAGGE